MRVLLVLLGCLALSALGQQIAVDYFSSEFSYEDETACEYDYVSSTFINVTAGNVATLAYRIPAGLTASTVDISASGSYDLDDVTIVDSNGDEASSSPSSSSSSSSSSTSGSDDGTDVTVDYLVISFSISPTLTLGDSVSFTLTGTYNAAFDEDLDKLVIQCYPGNMFDETLTSSSSASVSVDNTDFDISCLMVTPGPDNGPKADGGTNRPNDVDSETGSLCDNTIVEGNSSSSNSCDEPEYEYVLYEGTISPDDDVWTEVVAVDVPICSASASVIGGALAFFLACILFCAFGCAIGFVQYRKREQNKSKTSINSADKNKLGPATGPVAIGPVDYSDLIRPKQQMAPMYGGGGGGGGGGGKKNKKNKKGGKNKKNRKSNGGGRAPSYSQSASSEEEYSSSSSAPAYAGVGGYGPPGGAAPGGPAPGGPGYGPPPTGPPVGGGYGPPPTEPAPAQMMAPPPHGGGYGPPGGAAPGGPAPGGPGSGMPAYVPPQA